MAGSRKARPEDVDEICGTLPETELGISWGDRPTWKVPRGPLGELSRQELEEIIIDAWATKAPKRLVKEHLG